MAAAKPVPTERQHPQTDVQTLGNKYFALGVKDVGSAAERNSKRRREHRGRQTAPGIRRVWISDNSDNPIELFQLVN